MDIIGPLPLVQDFSGGISPHRYVVTFIDKFTRWMEAETIPNMSVEEVAAAFLKSWVSRFGCPLELITDRGRQFESELFQQLSSTLGFLKFRTTSFNLKCNGQIERQHRTLKNILRCHKENWLKTLPLAMFAMHITPSSVTQFAPFTLVTGTSIHTPKCFIENSKHENNVNQFIKELSQHMETLTYTEPIWNNKLKTYIPPDLKTCSKVWVRVDRIKKALESPYSGPYEVVDRYPNYFRIKLLSGKTDTVSINRLKPFMDNCITKEHKNESPSDENLEQKYH